VYTDQILLTEKMCPTHRFDRGAIRTILTVRNCTVLYYRDTVNLTSERVRARVIKLLAEKNVSLNEEPLIALDEACRQRSTPPPAHNRLGGRGPTFRKRLPNSLIYKSVSPLFSC
jgi:hypothetical protein